MEKQFNNSSEIEDILTNQVIDISKTLKNIKETISNGDFEISELKYIYDVSEIPSVEIFVSSIDYIMTTTYNLYTEFCMGNVNVRFINEKTIVLMTMIIEWRNKYSINGLAYKTLNTLLDILINSFSKVNAL